MNPVINMRKFPRNSLKSAADAPYGGIRKDRRFSQEKNRPADDGLFTELSRRLAQIRGKWRLPNGTMP
jgi:hypothetical protein